MFRYGKKHTAPHYKHVQLVVRLIIDGWDTDKTPEAIFVREGYCIVESWRPARMELISCSVSV